MANFRYQALTLDGKLVVGELQAESVQQAVAMLEAKELIVQSIGNASSKSGVNSFSSDTRAAFAAGGEHELLRAQMAHVLERSKAIVPALRAFIEELPSKRRRRQLSAMCRVIERGDVVEATNALKKLPDLWIPLLSAAMPSGDPARVLREFITESQHSAEIRRQWWLTLTYPLIVGGVAAAVMIGLSIFVIPYFFAIFDDFGVDLPRLTQFVMVASRCIASRPFMIVVGTLLALGAILVTAGLWMSPSLYVGLSRKFRLPFGRSTSIARFARFTADLLEAGLDIPSALRLTGLTSDNSRLGNAAWHLAGELESGYPFPIAKYRKPLTATILYALRAEIPTVSRIHLLRGISSTYVERVRNRLSWRGIIEPILIWVIGFLVGMVILALFVPLVELIKSLT